MKKLLTWSMAAVLLLWLVGWLWFGRHALLDDALIHLRYAQGLAETGFLTFDGATRSYGASSPLYVAVLAALVPVVSSPLLPKAVSILAYLIVLGLATATGLRDSGIRVGWICLVVILLAPMGQRWLTDGMETSLVGALVLLLAAVALRERPEEGVLSALLLSILGAGLVLLRVELSLALFFAALGTACVLPLRQAARRLAPLAAGSLAGLGFLVLTLGHVLPDTALAKRTVPTPLVDTLVQVGRSTVASLSFGAGLVILWAVTLALGLRRGARSERMALLATNLLLPCVVTLIALRGQILHGVRHVLWIYLFLIAWNLGILGRIDRRAPAARAVSPGLFRTGLAAGTVVLLIAWSFEAPAVASILRSRAEIFDAMRGQPLGRLEDAQGAASDVGFIAFFTGASILDGNGLVNGRAFAALPREERARRIGAARPDFLFVTREQAAGLAPFLDLGAYRACHRYRSVNLGGEQVHILAVRETWPDRLGMACRKPLPVELATEGDS